MAQGRLVKGDGDRPELLLGDGRRAAVTRNGCVGGAAVLLIDCSGSMSGERIEEARRGASSFAQRALGSQLSVGLAAFDTDATLLLRPTGDLGQIECAIQGLVTAGSTNMADGITLADGILGEHTPRTIVLVSDGHPDSPDLTLAAADEARVRDVDILCIGVDGADMEFLRSIATISEMAMHTSAAELHKTLTASVDLLRLPGRR